MHKTNEARLRSLALGNSMVAWRITGLVETAYPGIPEEEAYTIAAYLTWRYHLGGYREAFQFRADTEVEPLCGYWRGPSDIWIALNFDLANKQRAAYDSIPYDFEEVRERAVLGILLHSASISTDAYNNFGERMKAISDQLVEAPKIEDQPQPSA